MNLVWIFLMRFNTVIEFYHIVRITQTLSQPSWQDIDVLRSGSLISQLCYQSDMGTKMNLGSHYLTRLHAVILSNKPRLTQSIQTLTNLGYELLESSQLDQQAG